VLAPFTLTHLLRPLLSRAASARAVNLTGGIPGGPIEPDNLQGEKRYLDWTFSQYNHTKSMLMAMSRRLATTLAPSVTVNVAYPGHGHTPMSQALPRAAFPAVYRPLVPLLHLAGPRLFSDLASSAASSVYVAASDEMHGVTGVYVDRKCRRRPWPRSVTDEGGTDAVWELCERLGGPVLQASHQTAAG
jgi:NAD(P)-dependent dehydrogenase (short-subunit alcohol dehydrogenase family)